MPRPVADSKDVDIFIKCLNIKKYRELLCESYIAENPNLALAIIEHWKMKRIEEKYITKTRMYTENSYSKKQVKLDEKYFINKMHLFETYINFMDKQVSFEKHLNKALDNSKYESDNEGLYSIIFGKWEDILESNV